jgi:hypothetical protein
MNDIKFYLPSNSFYLELNLNNINQIPQKRDVGDNFLKISSKINDFNFEQISELEKGLI